MKKNNELNEFDKFVGDLLAMLLQTAIKSSIFAIILALVWRWING